MKSPTDSTQAPATPELVERLHQAGSRLGPLTRYGEDAVWRPATRARDALIDAATALEAQQARIAELEGGMKAALREVSKHAREAGEAISRLEMSESARILAGWRERAEAAEALVDRYEKALRDVRGLIAPRQHQPQSGSA